MSYEVYRYIFIGAAILCGIMLVLSVILFILLKVPKIIGDLSGRTAKKAIKSIREQNEASGDKYHKASSFNESRGRLTDSLSKSGQLHNKNSSVQFGIDTSKIATQGLGYAEQSSETTVLNAAETSVLDSGETSVLSDVGYGETSVLAPIDTAFSVEFEITYIHTNEVI